MNIPNINRKQIVELLKSDKRLDGRAPLDYRNIEIETGISVNAEGTARVRIGKTEVIVGVKMGVQEPYPDHEDEGTMMTSMEFSPLCGDRYENGPPKINSIETARVVDRGIRESGFIDWKGLSIIDGEKVWSIALDIYCINDDGNVLDAASMAAVAALRMSRFPELDEDNKVQYGELTNDSLPLSENVPFSMTFHKIGEKILIDPNREEEDSTDARVTIAISKVGDDYMINAMQKGELDSITCDCLNEMINNSEKVFDKVFSDIDKQTVKLMK